MVVVVAQRRSKKEEYRHHPPATSSRCSVEVARDKEDAREKDRRKRRKGRKEREEAAALHAFRNRAPWRAATPVTPESTIEKGKHVGPQSGAHR